MSEAVPMFPLYAFMMSTGSTLRFLKPEMTVNKVLMLLAIAS
jgi:hypothetical protein